jgi:hypothetical protein
VAIVAEYFIPKPKPTGTTSKHGHAVYLTESGQRLFWSADFPLPEIGERVVITMNTIGPAIVRGYFSEHGYLGLMTYATRPPKWLRDQNKRNANPNDPEWVKQGIGCEFGAELALPKRK